MTMRASLYPAALLGAMCLATLGGPAYADMEDPLNTNGDSQQAQGDVTDIPSQGMNSLTGDIYSQGMMAGSGAWAGEIYSQGMMMSTGQIYSQGTQITVPEGAANSPPSQECAGTASNCTDNVTNTPIVLGPPNNQSENLLPVSTGALPVSTRAIATASVNPVAEPAGLALLAPALLWFGLMRHRRNRIYQI